GEDLLEAVVHCADRLRYPCEKFPKGLCLASLVCEVEERLGGELVHLGEQSEVGVIDLSNTQIELSVHALQHSRHEVDSVESVRVKVYGVSHSHNALFRAATTAVRSTRTE